MAKGTIALSAAAQAKMALHAARHGFSNPIHGIVLGTAAAGADGRIDVVDAVPVCHEAPTKPLVDMALRLADAHLHQQSKAAGGVRIVGWYTANATVNAAAADGELPNAPASRIVASMAEGTDGDGEYVLLLVSTKGLVDEASPVCTVFERNASKTYTQRVDEGRVVGPKIGGEMLAKAMHRLPSSEWECDVAGGGTKAAIDICDFVDHLENGGKGDWLENGAVKTFVDSFR